MSRKSVHSKIDEVLALLSIHNSRLSLHSEKLSQLDIDVSVPKQVPVQDIVQEEPIKIPQEKQEIVQEIIKEKTPEPKKEEIAPKTTKKVEIKKKETLAKPAKPKKPQPKVEEEMLSLFEKFSSKPIKSIPKAISLAKRFEFQSVFFDGEPKEYNSFMASLDAAGDRESAFEIYHAYKNELSWDHEELKDELKALIYRMYA